MQPATTIDPKALRLTIILLRQYRPTVAKLLPGPAHYPTSGDEAILQLGPESITDIIASLNDLGDEWIEEAKRSPSETQKHSLRQQCLAFILEEWIGVAEQCQNQSRYNTVKAIIH